MNEAEQLSDRERRAWYGFLTMQEDLRRHLNRHLTNEAGISLSDFAVLSTLQQSETGALRMFELRAALRWEKTRLTHQVTRMMKRDLVARVQCEEDTRGMRIHLTATGRDTIEAALPDYLDHVRRVVFDVVTPRQLDALADVSEQVLEALAAEPIDD
ncbi:MarR family winged helix-turn-helix transcriptional regulator [Nocardiopsis protaetiae]|uniref:MarR family winged helix-turn-helix transcriptional regulator n=1 Tax=Nocardiopsis protaetiae TaxID=3382270 RepID=UPI00387B2112